MIILFGFRRRIARLGTAFLLCPYCQTPAAQVVSRVRRYFTVFFIPIIPLGGKFVVTCTMCGRGTQVSQETAESYLTSVAPTPGGVGAPVPAGQPGQPGPPGLSGPVPMAQPGHGPSALPQPEGPGHQP